MEKAQRYLTAGDVGLLIEIRDALEDWQRSLAMLGQLSRYQEPTKKKLLAIADGIGTPLGNIERMIGENVKRREDDA